MLIPAFVPHRSSAKRPHVQLWTSTLFLCALTLSVKLSLNTTPWSMQLGESFTLNVSLCVQSVPSGKMCTCIASCDHASSTPDWMWCRHLRDQPYVFNYYVRSQSGLRAIPNALCCEDHFDWYVLIGMCMNYFAGVHVHVGAWVSVSWAIYLFRSPTFWSQVHIESHGNVWVQG